MQTLLTPAVSSRHGGSSSSSSRASSPRSQRGHHRPSSQDLLLLAPSYGRASRPTSARVVVSSPAAAGGTGCRRQPHDLQGELPTARRQAMAVQEGRAVGRRGGSDYKPPARTRGGPGEQTKTDGDQQQHAGGQAAGHRPRVAELVSQLHRRRLLPVGVYLLPVEEESTQGPTAGAQTRGQMGWPRASCAASMAARAACFCSPVRPSGSVMQRHRPEAWTSAWLSSAASTRRSCTVGDRENESGGRAGEREGGKEIERGEINATASPLLCAGRLRSLAGPCASGRARDQRLLLTSSTVIHVQAKLRSKRYAAYLPCSCQRLPSDESSQGSGSRGCVPTGGSKSEQRCVAPPCQPVSCRSLALQERFYA